MELKDGAKYLVRARSTDLSVINEATMFNPYFGSGHIKLAADSVVLDVGANIGDLAVQLGRSCSRGRVYTVEPVSENMNMIRIQTLLNGIGNVVMIKAALGGAEGEVEINTAGSRSSVHWGDNPGEKVEKVRCTTLATVMQEQGIEKLDLLKLDCEGAEWEIFPTSEALLPRIRQICMEYHSTKEWNQVRLAEWLRARGYEVWYTGDAKTWNGLLWAVRKA